MGRPTKKEIRYRNVGRKPFIMTDKELSKLRECFVKSLTDEEACLYAGISSRQLYDYCKKNEEFRKEKELLKNAVNIKAKFNIIKKIDEGDVGESKWWLERKSGKEFNIKIISMMREPVTIDNSLSEEEQAEIDQLIEDNISDNDI